MAPDLPGAERPKEYYTAQLKETADYWSQCSNEGQAGFGSYTFCKYAYHTRMHVVFHVIARQCTVVHDTAPHS